MASSIPHSEFCRLKWASPDVLVDRRRFFGCRSCTVRTVRLIRYLFVRPICVSDALCNGSSCIYIYSTSLQSTATTPRRRSNVSAVSRRSLAEFLHEIPFRKLPCVCRGVDFTLPPSDGDGKINEYTPIIIVLPGLTGGMYRTRLRLCSPPTTTLH